MKKVQVKSNKASKTENCKWVSTFCIYEGGSIISFGNLWGKLYNTEDEAWKAIVSDFEAQKKIRGSRGINTYLCRNNNRASIDDVANNSGVIWEVQKMTSYNSKKQSVSK